jgi:uncharacterized membrane protein YraQ (UPF0718 family)
VEFNVNDFLQSFVSIVWEAFPFVVLGALIAGILEEVVPQQAISKIIPKNTILAVGIGSCLGLIFPMCECGIVPVMRRLLRKGLPLGTCVAYMLAGPVINPIVISSTWVAFQKHGIGPEMVGLRTGMAFVVAFIAASIVQFFYNRDGNKLLTRSAMPQNDNPFNLPGLDSPQVHPSEIRAGEKRPLSRRLFNISETALHDFKDIMVFLSLGAVLASFAKMYLNAKMIQEISTGFPAGTILGMMILSIIMCLCSEADAFVAASFKTMAPSAKLSFLVLGPMFDLKLLLMFTRVFRRKTILIIVISVFIQVFVYSLAVHYLWDSLFGDVAGTTSVEL